MEHFTYPKNKPLYEQVVDLIEAKIIQGEFQIGDKLPTENELAAIYKVSRTVVREAMKSLKEKGWVETRVAKGTFVIHNTNKNVQSSFQVAVQQTPEYGFQHLIEMRQILEPEIAALVAVRATTEDMAALEQSCQQMEDSMQIGDNYDSFLEGDFKFHMKMAESIGNPIVQIIMSPLVTLMRDTQKTHLDTVKGGNRKSQINHKLIMDALRKRNPDEARKCMLQHIIQVRTDVEAESAKNAHKDN